MKILEIVYGLASGGAERLVVDLCNELSKSEEVTLLLLKDVEQFYLTAVSVRVKVIQLRWPVGRSLSQHLKICQVIKSIAPDVVHYHSGARYSLILANLLLSRKYKFYMTIHSDVEKNYSKGVSGLQVRLAGHWGKCHFITISETNQHQFTKIHPKLKQTTIPNGRQAPQTTAKIDEVRQEMNNYRKNEDTTLFIHVARYHPCKNQETLVQAMNKLSGIGENVALVVIGTNFDSKNGQRIKQLAGNNIHFLGEKTNVYDYMTCADCFCLSSIYEGMPMTVIEARLSGLPIISTPVCGVIDVVDSGKDGIIATGYDPESYYNAIHEFISHKEEISLNAKKSNGCHKFSIAECTRKHIELFQKTIKEW